MHASKSFLAPAPVAMPFRSAALEVAANPKEQRSDSSLAKESKSGHARPDYLFVSNVRFLAMLSVVGLHTVRLWGIAPSWANHLQVSLVQAMKFGTIGFFLISGYLMGEGMTRTSRTRYFLRRVKAVFVPWVFWSLVWFAIALWGLRMAGVAVESAPHALVHQYVTFVFVNSIYWFVPNFFVCLMLVMWLHKRLPDSVQGTLFLACSLFYGLNIYWKLLPVRHTSALFGFVFYLWLGMFTYKHRDAWMRWMERISWVHLAIFAGVAAALSLGETRVLLKLQSVDEFNTLRISNQAFSVLMTLLIAKLKRPFFPKAIHVRSETFGIFLVHPILVQVFPTMFDRIPVAVRAGVSSNGPLLMLVSLATFAVIYLLSLLLTKVLRRSQMLSWAVGVQ